jgi:hypothetical protein
MTEVQASYRVSPMPANPPHIIAPLDPRTRALVIGIRAALLLLADALGAYAGLPKRD